MKTNKNMNTRKAIFILAAFLGLQFNTIFAAGNYSEANVSTTSSACTTIYTELAPTAPKEATFEEYAELNDGAPLVESNIILLAPVTPSEADFEDEPAIIAGVCISVLTPVTPIDAEFEESL